MRLTSLAVLLDIVLLGVALSLNCVAATNTERAWSILKEGSTNKNLDNRAKSVQALGLIPGSPEAEALAVNALNDPEAKVRAVAAAALGQMKAAAAVPQLRKALDDHAAEVVLAAADSLTLLNDPAGFELDYEMLMRKRKTGGTLMDQERDLLHHPKELEKLGFEQGIGFIPYGSMTMTAFRMITKDTVTPIRAKAARALAKDPDPKSAQALVDSLKDEKWLVRASAAAALAERNDASQIGPLVTAMDDPYEIVSYTAAAGVVHLSMPSSRMRPRRPIKHYPTSTGGPRVSNLQ